MPESVPDQPGVIRQVANWVVRILPLAVLLALMAWGASTIARIRQNPACEPASSGEASIVAAENPGKGRCK